MPDELSDLFPNLAGIVSNWQGANGSPANDPLIQSPEHGGVTDDQITAYFANRLGGRAPLAPIVNGQQVPGQPQFQAGVGGTPPPAAYVEGGAPGASGGTGDALDTPGALPPTGPNTSSQDGSGGPEIDPLVPTHQASEQTPSEGTSSPDNSQDQPDSSEEAQFIEFNGRRIDTQRIEAWDEFDERLRNDPVLRQTIAEYMVTGRLPSYAQPTAPVAQGTEGVAQPPTPSNPAFAPLTPPADLDMDDPAIKSLWSVMEQQHALLSNLAQGQQMTQQAFVQQTVKDQEAIVNAALDQFKSRYELNDQELQEVRVTAARLNVVESFMQGVDPITGAPVTPNAHNAVMRALDLAYQALPQYKDREFERLTRQRIADNARKQKAGALSGSSGSTPRTQPAPTTEAGRKAALHDEVAKMFAGTWSAPDQ